jgi:hypothetical protein
MVEVRIETDDFERLAPVDAAFFGPPSEGESN